jgi:hypothetical protein
MAMQKLGVLAREDVVRHDAEAHRVAKSAAQSEQERRLAAADRSADAYRECTVLVAPWPRRFAIAEESTMGRVGVPMSVGAACVSEIVVVVPFVLVRHGALPQL